MSTLRTLGRLAIVVGVSALTAAPGLAQDSFKIGIDAAYRPFAYVDEQGILTGFEVDLARAVCEEMKVTCDISNIPWDGIFAALDANQIDMVGTTVTKTPERLEKYDASVVINRVGYAFIVPQDFDVSGGLDALKGEPIGTITGTEPYYKFIRGMLGEDADIRGYQNPDAAVLDLDAGRITAFMSDNFQLEGQFVNSGDYKYVVEPNFDSEWTGEGRVWFFRKGTDDLVAKVDAALASVMAKPLFQELGMKYFGMQLRTE